MRAWLSRLIYLFMSAILFPRAYSSFQTFGQAALCLLRLGFGCRDAFSFCSLFSLAMFWLKWEEGFFYMPTGFSINGMPFAIYSIYKPGNWGACKNINYWQDTTWRSQKDFSTFVPFCGPSPVNWMAKKWLMGHKVSCSGILQLGRKGMQLLCDPSFAWSWDAVGIKSAL